MQIAGRLVRQDQLRLGDDGAGHTDELLLATRQLAGVQVFLPDDLEPVEHVAHDRVALGPLHVAIRQRHLEILVDGQVVQQVIALKDEPDVRFVKLGALLWLHRVHRLVEQEILPSPRAVVHPQDVQQGRFARAGGPHDRQELTVGDVEVDLSQHVCATGTM